MTVWCLRKSRPPSSDSDNDGDDTDLQIPKLSEVLSAINVCRHYISVNSLISLQNEVYALNARKVKQTKLSDSFKIEQSS
jgi:hypothetical protein